MKNSSLIIMALSMITSSSFAASFDCTKARLASEKQICAVRSLNDSDVKLDTLYHIVLQSQAMGSRAEEQDVQRQWLHSRNQCGSDTACIANAYQIRQQHLQQYLQQRVLRLGPF